MNPKLKHLNENDKVLAKIILPESIVEVKTPLIKKDFQFYNKVGKNWLGAEASSPRKNIAAKLKKNSPKAAESVEEQIKKAKLAADMQRMAESRFKFKIARRKNATLQYISEQPINNWEEFSEVNQLVVTDKSLIESLFSHNAKVKMRGRADNVWNDFTDAPKKAVYMVCPPKVLKIEENAIERIKERQQKLEFFSNLKKEWLDDMKKESKERLEGQKMKTSSLLLKCQSSMENKSKVPEEVPAKSETNQKKREEVAVKIDDSKKFRRPLSGRQEVLKMRPLSSVTVKSEVVNLESREMSRTDKLSKPKRIYHPDCELQKRDLRGLYLADIPMGSFETETNAYSKLLGRSPIFKENLSDFQSNTRPRSSEKPRPKVPDEKIKTNFKFVPAYKLKEFAIQYRTFDDFNKEMDNFSQNKGDLKDVDHFEEVLETKKKPGFSKVNLEEAQKLSSAEGFKGLRQQRSENPQYPRKKINS